MHFVLVGPGALGCLLSYFVQKGCAATGDRLTLLDYHSDRARQLSEQGIEYKRDDTSLNFAVQATSDLASLQGDVDVILLCVKSYDVQASLEFCTPLLTADTLLVFMQNGISHLDVLNSCGNAATAFGTTTEGATLLSQGKVRHAGSGTTYLGFLSDQGSSHAAAQLKQTATVLSESGLDVAVTETILTRLWAKLFINVGINALTASLGCTNGELLTLPGIKTRMEKAVREAETVARAKNIPVEQDPFQQTCMVSEKTGANISSMLQDVRNRKRTEIDAINGAISAYGRQLGVQTPENDRLCAEIKRIEAAYPRRGESST